MDGLNEKTKKDKKDIALKLVIALIFIIGIGLILYPVANDIKNKVINYNLQKSYEEKVKQRSSRENEQILEDAKGYNKEHQLNIVIDAFKKENQSDADTTHYQYDRVLSAGEKGMMGYVEIPKININLAIFHRANDATLEEGAGHLAGTSLPVGGKNTHAALMGHRGLPEAKLFTDLDQLKKGDKFYIHVVDKTLAYKIKKIRIIEPKKLNEHLAIIENEDLVTLVTCTPYGVNSHRMLLTGCRVPLDSHKEANPFEEYIKYGIVIGCVGLLGTMFYVKRKKRRKYENKDNL